MRKLSKSVGLIAAVMTLCLAGCAAFSKTKEVKLQSGYFVKIHKASESKGEEGNPQIELLYQAGGKEKQVLWPRIINSVIHDGNVVFIGELGGENSEDDRLFAFSPGGPVMDVTRQVIEFAVREKMRGVVDSKSLPPVGVLVKAEEGFEIQVGITGWSTPYIDVKWDELEAMMGEARLHGVARKDEASGAEYVEKPREAAGNK